MCSWWRWGKVMIRNGSSRWRMGAACGKPVIGGAHGGAPEVIDDGKTGYLVQHGDAGQLATSLETLLVDPELGREMGARGRERVEQEFRFNVFAKSLKKILRDLCDECES